MAVVTSNGKRPHRCLSVNQNHPSPTSLGSKRPRLSASAMSHNRNHTPSPFPTNTTVSRLSRYPEAKPPLHREVHAPCRPRKLRFPTSSRTDSSSKPSGFSHKGEIPNDIGNALLKNYQLAKNSALATIGLWGKGKGNRNNAVSEDSSVEEVHFIEEGGREVRSVVTDHKLQETEIKGLDAKVVRGGLQQRSTSSVVSELTDAVDAAKMLDTLSLSQEHDISSVHAYRKLLEAVGERTDTISRLRLEIRLNEKRRSAFDLMRPKKELVELTKPYCGFQEVPWEPFVPLTKGEEVEVARAFSANRKKILVTHEKSNIEISGEKFQCLRPGAWLNDEVINLYLELLKERERREPHKFLNCHFFNTFFYKKLISGKDGYDFKSVRRWTSQKKLGYGLHECDKIFVPIHKEIHWCLAVINKKDKKFQYLDSLKGMDTRVLGVLARYFVDEVKDKTGQDIDIRSWGKEFVEDLPEQENGYDCGVFMIKYADFYSRNLRLCFNQEHMPYFRLKTAKEILRLKAD